MSAHTAVLEIDQLTVRRAGQPDAPPILNEVSLRIEAGQMLGVIGESGAGKSTLGLLACAFLKPGLRRSAGQIRLNGQDLSQLAPQALLDVRRRHVAYVAQSASAAFNPAVRLIDQITEISRTYLGISPQAARERAWDLMRLLDLQDAETLGQRYAHEVSGGQLQRMMTAMALCNQPDLIVFDEPTTALDTQTQTQVLAAIRHALSATGTAALYISHDLPTVAGLADHLLVLRHGHAVESGPAQALLADPQQPYTRQLLQAQAAVRITPPGPTAPSPALEVKDVSLAWPSGQQVLDRVTLTLPPGRTLALVGPSGTGKSTLAKVICGLVQPSQGQVRITGEAAHPDVLRRSADQRRRLQWIHQMPDLALNPQQTVFDAIARPLAFFAKQQGATLRERVHALLRQVELDPATFAHRLPPHLSGGQKQRVCIARALAADPAVLVCDEPTSALDPLIAQGVLALLNRLQAEHGLAILLISHDLTTVQAMADEVFALELGQLRPQNLSR